MSRSMARRRAYPRLRGEHIQVSSATTLDEGLPPLARGAPRADGTLLRGAGPTPACAGSTWAISSASSMSRAYPRLRGEHSTLLPGPSLAMGLPPLARGARCDGQMRHRVAWPTPACAGSTDGRHQAAARSKAYPRLRGEHSARIACSAAAEGLPPLARGAPNHVMAMLDVSRPTPACAGSTITSISVLLAVEAYPRLRGEHIRPNSRPETTEGLPPLARGAPRDASQLGRSRGPTPACAGSTSRGRRGRRR